jgi:hypothetical protein
MKKLFAYALFALSFLAGAPAAFAQNTDTDTATGSVTIIRPLTVTKSTDLAFGTIVKPATGTGTVSIANNSTTVSATDGAVSLTGTGTHAIFTANGEGGQAVNVTVGSLTMANGASNIAVTLSPDVSGATTLSGALGGAGSKTVNIGGSFTVPSALPTGAYTGTFDVTVAYQ